MIATQCVTGAAIIGLDGSVWAAKNLALKAGEGKVLVTLFPKDDAGTAAAFSNGIMVGGVKHLCIRADKRSVYGKKGAGGVVLVKTIQCVIIGKYDESIQPGQATTVVEKLGDYLIENGC